MIRTLTLVTALAVSGQGLAADSSDEAGRELVDSFVNDVVTFAGSFKQSLIDAEGQVLEVTSGTLEIQRPGRFRWAYAEPYEQWLIADGLNIWSYDVDLEQVTVKPQAEALANTPALLLGGAETAMEQFDYQGTASDEGMTWVSLVPVDTSSGFKKVELGFADTTLTQMVFFDNLEQTTFVSLADVAVNEPIAAERFEFAVPEGVDLVGRPATPAASAE